MTLETLLDKVTTLGGEVTLPCKTGHYTCGVRSRDFTQKVESTDEKMLLAMESALGAYLVLIGEECVGAMFEPINKHNVVPEAVDPWVAESEEE